MAGRTIPVAAAMLIAAVAVVQADEAPPAFIDNWYAAQLKADAPTLAALIADDATFSIADPAVRSKADFVRTLVDWRAVAGEGTDIKHKMDGKAGDAYQILVCYIFPDSEAYSRETLRLRGGKVVA